jgi:hypothetical protein
MEKLLSNLPIDYLQHLAYLDKIAKKKSSLEEFNVNGESVYKNESLNLYSGEKFRKHPNINLYVSNYGRIKDKEGILKQEIEKEGYLYVSLFYSSLMFDNVIANKKEYKFSTPSIVFKKINIDKEIEPIYRESYVTHPFLQLHRNKRGNFFSIDYDNHKCFYKTSIGKNGIETFFIPIYVYRLVAETWKTKPKGYTEVHHIINNGYDNTVFNLMWVTNDQHKMIEKRKW